MKKASDDLFRLIKSLTKSEKGYFKKFASRNTPGGKSNYISLFDSIDKMESYDEDILKKNLKDKQLLSQLPVYKVYLFNLILKALQQYSSFDNTDAKLTEMISSAKILVKKQMPKEALKLLNKAKEIAYKYDNEKSLLEILFAERNIMMVIPDKHILEKEKDIYEEQKQFIERLNNRFRYTWLSDQMVMYVEHKGDFKNVYREQEIKKIMSDPCMKSINKTIGFSSKAFFYHTHIFYYISIGDIQKLHEYTKKEIAFHEQYSHFINQNPKNYISALLNYLLSAHMSKNRKDVNHALRKLVSVRNQYGKQLSSDLETELFMKARNTELIIYADNCELEKGRNTVKSVEEDLKKYRNYLGQPLKVTLLYNCSHVCFLDDDFNRSLYFINKLLNESEDLRKDIYNFAKLLNLVVHYELGNIDHLEYITENTSRYLKQRKSFFKVEELIINAIRKILNTADKKEIKNIFEELLRGLMKTAIDLKSRQTFEFFDFISWAQSKVTGEKYSDVKKRNAKGM